VGLLGLVIPLLFLFFNLKLLFVLSVVTWAFLVVCGVFFTAKPAAETRKQR
jgi:hypothetical protein